MRIILTIFFSVLALGTKTDPAQAAEDCKDYSHRFVRGTLVVDYKQIDCSKLLLTFIDPEGSPYLEREIEISAEFKTTEVDDQHETYTNQQRWSFSRNGQTLIHDVVLESFNKATLGKTFYTIIEVFSHDTDGTVLKSTYKTKRFESKDGSVRVTSKHSENSYDPL